MHKQSVFCDAVPQAARYVNEEWLCCYFWVFELAFRTRPRPSDCLMELVASVSPNDRMIQSDFRKHRRCHLASENN